MGEVFAGRYELVDPIGRGGVGAVWRTWDHRRRRYVAAKVLQQRDAHALLRFVREQAVRIDHPHVLAPASWAADDDKVLFTMDLVAGGSLVNLVNDYGPLPPVYVCGLLDQLLSGLAAVHAEGVIHRDIKPANVLLEATGTARPRLRLSDFGIAMRLGEPRLTETNYVVGTPGYFAPEQMLGADPDFPADLFAVGLVALYLLEGAKPDAKALIEHFASHGTPKAPRGIPEPLWQVIATLLQPDPNSRFRTATGARKALAAATELLPEPGPDDELVEIFDQLGPLPQGFAPEGPLHRASGLDKADTSTGAGTGGISDATPPPPHHPPAYGPPPMDPPSQPGSGPALPAPLPGAAPQPSHTATGSVSAPPMPSTAPPQTGSSNSGNGSAVGTGATDMGSSTTSGAGTGPGTGHWSQDPGPASSASSASSPQAAHLPPEPPPTAVPPRPERAPAPPRPSTMSDTGSFHLPPPQVLTADAPSRQVEQHTPGLGHPPQQPEQHASHPAGTPVRTAPAQHPEPAHVPSPQSHPPLGLAQAPASAVQQHAYASTGSYTARPPQVPRRSRALPRRRPGPPVKVVVPVLLVALVCFAVGFWALGQL
ncbi:serine/threonine-protein kinase [Streptomyces akebiae]|uniref:non-specific serine/threonine protein kinase n=1 Tax=Streptomyces akebiae TaxID=2865673 RepID=A0ABX8XSU0_9ACTN|nr:serine/threonine-protein kinase [Streptomyces akebiae]QYX78817.1 protein kinase [Streptomyces akebiae]